jgi:hypothetical protein
MAELRVDGGSFRDRANRIFCDGDQVYRSLGSQALEEWAALQNTQFFPASMANGRIVPTRLVDQQTLSPGLRHYSAGALQHERIPFISYPYEWPFSMLQDAALLQLELLQEALHENFTFKDASPYNIQWRGVSPVFIDTPSIQPLPPGSPWIGYRQFCELFLYPLFLQSYRRVPFQPWMRASLNGISTSDARLLFARDFFRRGVLTHVLLHAQLQKSLAGTGSNIRRRMQAAGFPREFIEMNVRRMHRLVASLRWKQTESAWSDYAEECPYTMADEQTKKRFVENVLGHRRRKLVWDLGCNQGEYSAIAAKSAETVVAVDSDPLVIERLYKQLRRAGSSNILPLTMDLANPSPSQGWRSVERKSFVERGRPELVLCLALTHHVCITSQLPLNEWVGWLASLHGDLVIEFVTRQDPMVMRLLRQSTARHPEYDQDVFEAMLAEYYDVRDRLVLSKGNRIMYDCRLRKKR